MSDLKHALHSDLRIKNRNELVSADVSLFGTILELPDRLVVLPSKGEPLEILGEPVNWRVFPRSRHYENHLHVIFDDHIAIFSFNHDYLIDQTTKISGVSARATSIDHDTAFSWSSQS